MDDDSDGSDDLLYEQAGTLDRRKHIERLSAALDGTASQRQIFVPLQTWTVYWVSHSLALLEQHQVIESQVDEIIKFAQECADPEGGFGGGPGQIGHLATTFGAVNALITTRREEALESIDRLKLLKFFRRMKKADGSFMMHEDGEVDSRASYLVLAVLRCLNIHDSDLMEKVADWVLSCQTYEGGFGSVPGSEAHGGYTFCCVASLCLLKQLHRANMTSLVRWLVNKQLELEGGFCGRSNKLVDSCYSYWQGAVFPLLHPFLESALVGDKTHSHPSKRCDSGARDEHKNQDKSAPNKETTLNRWLFDGSRLQEYVLDQCQDPGGLLRDKPGVNPDFYHTCYALSGLSLSQHQPDGSVFDIGSRAINQLAPTSALFNVTSESLDFCFNYFQNKRIEILTAR